MGTEDENLALARAWLGAFARGDADALIRGLHPEVEIHAPPEVGNEGTYRGHDGYRQWAGQWMDAWERFENEILSAERIGRRHVVVEARQRATGRGSGIRIDREVTMLFEVRDGRVSRFHVYPTREQAVAVAREGELRP